MELRDIEAFGEPGAIVYLADCVELMRLVPAGSVDVVFADPPYRLSTGGVTVKNGRLAPVDKGAWDRSMGFQKDHEFNVRLAAGGAAPAQAGRHHLGYGHPPHHLQHWFRAAEPELPIDKRDPFIVQTSAPTLSGSGKAPVISMEPSGQILTLSRSIL